MPGVFAFLRCVGEAVVARGLRGLVGLVPYGDQLCDIASHAWRRWKELNHGPAEPQLRRELELTAQASPEPFAAEVRQVVLQIAADQPPAVQQTLTDYLTLVPARLRQTFARQDDPDGKTVPAALLLRGPEDLLPLLPPRPPRFQAGQSPPNEPRWELVERLGVGGFGEVWKARHRPLEDHFTAFKFCLGETKGGGN